MRSYPRLDRIADAHNPVLGAVWLGLQSLPLRHRHGRRTMARFAVGLACLYAYGCMRFDAAVPVGSRAALDYSIHAGVAVALLAAVRAATPRLAVMALVFFAVYVPLRVFQGYHTLPDIVTSALAVAVPALLIAAAFHKRTCAAGCR